jgi:hypothetical protein
MSKRPSIQISSEVDGKVEDYAENRDMSRSEAYEQLLDFALDFRPPKEEEKVHLINKLIEYGHNPESAEHMIRNMSDVAVLDNFVSGSPGYVGPLIFVVHGYPETYTLYQYEDYENGEITVVEQEG